jgi:AraC-like DNA-binding protein
MASCFNIESARLLQVGHLHTDATWSFASHSHPHWEFVYFLRGCGSVDLPHTTLRPQYFHLLVFYPGLMHAECADPTDPEETIFLGVDVEGIVPPGASLLLPDPRGDLRWLCERMLEEYAAERTPTPLAETYVRAFLQLIERSWESTVIFRHNPVNLAVQYLLTNYANDISLNMLAQVAHLSPMYLTHRFTQQMGVSPMRYLKQLRVEAARQLLVTTDLPVNEIAHRVGYADPLYFRRVFKSITGHTPTSLR